MDLWYFFLRHTNFLRIKKMHQNNYDFLRIKAVYNELTKLGAKVTELEDGLIIDPAFKYNENVEIDTYDDHRMAMRFSLAGLRIPGVKIFPLCVKNFS